MSITDIGTGRPPSDLADAVILHMASADGREPRYERLSPVQIVPIASLRTAGSPRLTGENSGHVRALAETEATLPPIVVHRATMRVVDGLHRLRAALLRGWTELPVRFFDGSEQDAFVLSVELNVKHGLPLSTADRAAAATRILEFHPHWSDRAVASAAGLSARTVCAIRQRMEGPEAASSGTRVGRDGRVRPLSTAAARRQASILLTERPEASLREVAATVGISPGTVRDVRNRLLRGEDPVPPSQRERATPRMNGRESGRTAHQDRGRRAGSASGTRRTAQAASGDAGELLRVLSRDPSVRLTESGRHLLRLFASHAVPAERREQLAENVPAHCAALAAGLARSCAESWLDLARRLEERSA